MNVNHSIPAALFAITLFVCACTLKNNHENKSSLPDSVQQNATYIKLKPVKFGGNRYVIEADLGMKKKVPLMIHGNAKLYLMITHDIAEKLNNGNPVEKIRDYGYSDKGMGKVTVNQLQIGNKTFSNIEDVSVFDWPKEDGKAAQGMLGIQFLVKEKVRIDFAREQLEIGVTLSELPDQSLLDQGYSFTKFFIENGEGFMNVYFDSLKKDIPITVGTVSDEYSFDVETFKNGIKLEKTDSKESSPSRTTPQVFTNVTPVKYTIANQSFEIPGQKVSLYSFAEYENVKQAELFPFGIFGRDWMKENKAILDYANKILYFKAPK